MNCIRPYARALNAMATAMLHWPMGAIDCASSQAQCHSSRMGMSSWQGDIRARTLT